MRRLMLVGALIVSLTTVPAAAKGPAMTWETEPGMPKAGEPASIVLRTWEWTEDGQPDTTRPADGFFGQSVLHLPVRVYPAPEFPHIGPTRVGMKVPRLVRVSPSVYRGTVTFPRPGEWVLAWRGYHPGDPDRSDRVLLEVRVGSSRKPGVAATRTEGSSAGTKELLPIALAMVGVVLAALTLGRRRVFGSSSGRRPTPGHIH
jgi:hypothetical protein